MTYRRYKNSAFTGREKGGISLTVAIIIGLFLLSVLYLIQTNSVVARNYELRSTQNFLREKRDANQKMAVALIQAQSMGSLENVAKNLSLVGVEDIGYLKVAPDFFALSQNP